jgi:uncharacterized protein YjiS (DUF1127 family)
MTIATPAFAALVPGSERTPETRTGGLRSAWHKHRAYRATLAEMADMTERQLADIGTSRATLKRFARTATYGR